MRRAGWVPEAQLGDEERTLCFSCHSCLQTDHMDAWRIQIGQKSQSCREAAGTSRGQAGVREYTGGIVCAAVLLGVAGTGVCGLASIGLRSRKLNASSRQQLEACLYLKVATPAAASKL